MGTNHSFTVWTNSVLKKHTKKHTNCRIFIFYFLENDPQNKTKQTFDFKDDLMGLNWFPFNQQTVGVARTPRSMRAEKFNILQHYNRSIYNMSKLNNRLFCLYTQCKINKRTYLLYRNCLSFLINLFMTHLLSALSVSLRLSLFLSSPTFHSDSQDGGSLIHSAADRSLFSSPRKRTFPGDGQS